MEYEQPSKEYLKNLKPIIPIDEWPIHQLTLDKKEFMEEVIENSYQAILEMTGDNLDQEISKTLYQEKIRLTRKPWLADKPTEPKFWDRLQNEILDPARTSETDLEILHKMIEHYVEEIVGVFKPRSYHFAQKVVPALFARFLSAATGKNVKGFFSSDKTLHDKIHIRGDVGKIRNLAREGTLIIVPTHFSNLDSILIGWVIYAMGLPAFTYGAGLNLFGIRILAYFMNRLGAYKVDRRKKSAVYLQTLKMYSQKAIERNCHSLFFPGGTRSRSGALEQKLKLGLLSTAIDAQYENILKAEGDDFKKIYVVPAVLNYNFVLEAPALIKEFLMASDPSKAFIENDAYSTSYKISKFLAKFFRVSSEIIVSFGECMDLFGNPVDDNGVSHTKNGRPIDIREYFLSKNELRNDTQRNNQYTQHLSERIIASYFKYNVVMASQMVARAAFKTFREQYSDLEMYALLRLPKEDRVIDQERFLKNCEELRDKLLKMHAEGRLDIEDRIKEDLTSAVEYGIKHLGQYHSQRPLRKEKRTGRLISDDLRVLYFYHNRLNGYRFDD